MAFYVRLSIVHQNGLLTKRYVTKGLESMSKQSPSPGAADGPGNPEPQLGKTNATQVPVDISKKAELGLGAPVAPDPQE